MRQLLLFLMVTFAAVLPGFAIDLGGVSDLVAEKLKETKGATLLSLNGTWGGALELPIWTFHGSQGPDYLEVSVGGMLQEGGRKHPLVSVAVNLPALSGWLWRSAWAQAHVRRAQFPPIFAGPYVLLPMPGGPLWTPGTAIGWKISVGLGKGGSE